MTTIEGTPLLVRTLEQVELSRVTDNPWQPRAQLDPEQVKELAESIAQVGLLQPPLVRPHGEGYQVAFGHYRIAALRQLGVDVAELEVRVLTDADMAVIALTENKKRRDVAPIEQYRAWQKALEIEGMSVAMLATTLGLDRSTVSNNLRLLKLPSWVLKYVDEGLLSAHAAREFLCLMGSDGHFHDDVARQVMDKLTTGTPDWRADRVRWELNEAVCGRPVSEWRRLFRGTSPGGGHAGEPGFDLERFKEENAPRVHTLPNDKWGGQEWGRPTNSKVTETRSRDWTCATSSWAARQSASKKAAEGVATAAAKSSPAGKPVKSGSFSKVLAADPVFATVSPETAGPLLKTVGTDQLDAEAAAALGTRAQPVQLEEGKKQFKAHVGAEDLYERYNWNLTRVPSYFPNIEECRKTCIIGATYGRFSDSGNFALFCLNKQHFEEKAAQGRETIMRKVERKKAAIDEADERLYVALEKQLALAPTIGRLLAAVLVTHQRFDAIHPDNVDYGTMQELRLWPANTERIAELLGDKSLLTNSWLDSGKTRKALEAMDEPAVKELLARLVVEPTRSSQLEPFVKKVRSE